jgi:protein-S-isoprenylcysteine O-methyltransferase Ste14
VKRQVALGAVKAAIFYIILAVVLFAMSGKLDWAMAWVLLGIFVASYVVNLIILDPELMAERSGVKEGTKRYDIVLAMFMSGLGMLVVALVAGLDKRFVWSVAMSPPVLVAGVVLILLGCVFVTWAMASNRFFGPVVRIQTERGHTVASAGPYKIVRHPGYLGAALTFLGVPLMLGTLWALIPVFFILVDIVVRTALEDRVLQNELTGYREFAARVKHRLLPGIW